MGRTVPDGLPGGVSFDLALLQGIRFACRPDCGLCCFAEPRVEPDEEERLLRLDPTVRLRRRGRARFIGARPEGGACALLADHHCRLHTLRPHPCREFPLTVHVGHRLQVSAVLSCPGVELARLDGLPSSGEFPEPEGLGPELAALSERLGPAAERRLALASRRGDRLEEALQELGRWEDDERVRARLGADLPLPGSQEFPVPSPPAAEEGLELLPLYFDHRRGPVALAGAPGAWELLELSAEGGGRSLGRLVPPDRPPTLAPEARTLFEGYLRYSLARDAFLAAVHLEMLNREQGSVAEWAARSLRELGADVLSRAVVRAKLRRVDVEPLSAPDIADGIRATDQDWLDRPTWGERF